MQRNVFRWNPTQSYHTLVTCSRTLRRCLKVLIAAIAGLWLLQLLRHAHSGLLGMFSFTTVCVRIGAMFVVPLANAIGWCMMLLACIQVITASIVENWYQTALSLTPFAAAALTRVEGMTF